MFRGVKRFLAGVLVAAVAVTAVPASTFAAKSPTVSVKPVNKTNVTAEKKNGIQVKVDTNKKGTATIGTVKTTDKKTITIDSKVKVGKVSYKVTTISSQAFKNCKKATKIELPSTITKIDAKAFTGANKLKTLKLTGKTAPKIDKNAFKGVDTKKITIVYNSKMSSKELKELKATLKKIGFKGKLTKSK